MPLRDSRAIELAVRLFLENPDVARRFQSYARKWWPNSGVAGEPEHLAQYEHLLGMPLDRKPLLQRLF